MGRFVSGSSVPRALRQVFDVSNPAFAIPSWARFLRVSGVGGGGSGGVRTTTGSRASGGASGFHATDLPLIIPAGATTIAVAIGAAGGAVSAAAAVNGNAGGDTTLSIAGVLALRLSGGPGGQASGFSPPLPSTLNAASYPVPNFSSMNGLIAIGGPSPDSQYLNGAIAGGDGSSATGGFGAGGSSFFGAGGLGIAAAPSANTNGANAGGFGAGGAGGLWLSGGAAVSGAGAPGILICEFLEALQ